MKLRPRFKVVGHQVVRPFQNLVILMEQMIVKTFLKLETP